MAVNILNNPTNLIDDISQLTKGHGGKKGSKPFMLKNLLESAEIAQGSIYVPKKSQKVKNKTVISKSEESQVVRDENTMGKSRDSAKKNPESDPDSVDTYA
jgi:hypothetical protein